MTIINTNEEAKRDATCRNMINLMEDVAAETGFCPIFGSSKVNKAKNLVFFLIPPGKTFNDRSMVGDWPNSKIKTYMLDMLKKHRAAQEPAAPTLIPKPITSNLSRDKFKGIVFKCSVLLLGKMINILHDELKLAYTNGKPYTTVDGLTFNMVRKYAQVYNAYGKFKNTKVINNVRTTLLSEYTITHTGIARKAIGGVNIFPPKYGVQIS